MGLKAQIDGDLKTAMLAGDKTLVSTLRGIKSAILNMEVATGTRGDGLPEDEITSVLAKEAKKRQESADLYVQGGNPDRAEAEIQEKMVIEKYLPAQLSEDEIKAKIDEAISELGATSPGQMGQVIGAVKAKTGPSADGALIARLVKERLM